MNTQCKQLINSNHSLVTFEMGGLYASFMLSRSIKSENRYDSYNGDTLLISTPTLDLYHLDGCHA